MILDWMRCNANKIVCRRKKTLKIEIFYGQQQICKKTVNNPAKQKLSFVQECLSIVQILADMILKIHVIKNVEGRNSDVTNLAGLAAIQDSQRSRIGFVDPRITAVADYGDTPEGINPSHNPTRSTGLTLDLDHSPKKDKIAIPYKL